MQTATNKETGEKVVLIGDKWEPFEQSATNEKGERAYFVGGKWVSDSQIEESGTSAVGALSQGINYGLAGGIPTAAGAFMGGKFGAPLGPWGVVGGAVLGGLAASPAAAPVRGLLNKLLPGAAYNSVEELPQELRPIGRAGEVIGGSVPFAAAPFATSKPLQELPGVVRPVVRAARESPKAFLAAEAGGAFGAAQGAGISELIAPGNQTAAFTGEVLGGAVNPVGLATKGVRRFGGSVVDYAKGFSRQGREAKAAQILQDAMQKVGENPQEVAARLREASELSVPMTSGQKADSPTLLAFEATLASKSPDFDTAMKGQTAESFKILRKIIGDMEMSGDPELVRIAAKTRDQYFKTLLEVRLREAQTKAEFATKPLVGDRAGASVRATEILESSLQDARKVERALWSEVPRDVPVKSSNVSEAYDNIVAGGYAERPAPPEFVAKFAERAKTQGEMTSGELLAFRSDMLARARNARGQKDWVNARIYEDMADGALADIAGIPGNASDKARAWSKQLHDTFTRTFAGDALSVKGTGADRIVPEAVLERGFGSGGTMANKRFAQLQEAAQFTGKGMLNEQEEFIRAAAAASTDPQTGTVNPKALENFKRKNASLLERFPSLNRDLSNAANAEQAFRDVQSATDTASRAIAQRSAFARVLKSESPSDVVQRIVGSQNPQREYRDLVKLAKRGPDGAIDGLKASTLDYAARAATSGTGEFSFSRYNQILNQPMSGKGPSLLNTMRRHEVMSSEEVNRMNIMLRHAERIERSVKSQSKMAELVAEPDMLFDLVVRAVGANIGGASAMGQASGAPLVLAGAGSRAARNLMEKVPRTRVMDVLMEASRNPVMMARLLEKPATIKRAVELGSQMNAFLIQAGIIQREDRQEPQ